MPASEPQLDRNQQHQSARFSQMGLKARPMPDGRSLLVSLPISPTPFETVAGPLEVERVVFSTVGPSHIKCLRPRTFFALPLLDIRDCQDPAAIEGSIRRALRARTQALREARRRLEDWGVEADWSKDRAALVFPIAGEVPNARVRLFDLSEIVLPGAGPLSGVDLGAREERVIELGPGIEDAADLECLIGSQIETVRRQARKREAAERERNARVDHPLPSRTRKPVAATTAYHHRPKVLIVGPGLIQDEELRAELKRQGYRAATARSETEALIRLSGMTPDLVLSEYALGRSDGATLVQATRAVPGIDRMPVVLLDETAHESRREAARAVGAAGYVVAPTEKRRFVARLGRLLSAPPKRRYTRYPERLSARLAGLTAPCVATEVGRGGVFIATEEDIDLHSAMRCELALPELGRDLRFEAEVLYRAESQGALPGLGLRFFDISPEDEAALIAYLTSLETRGGA